MNPERIRRSQYLCNTSVLTDNIAGVEQYLKFSRLKHERFSIANEQRGLSDHIACTVLPGFLSWEYACTLGPTTTAALRNAKDQASSNTIFISLLAANWVRLEGRVPHPLVHNTHLIDFKQAILDVSDECYLPVSICKIFRDKSVAEINEWFKKGGKLRDYREVRPTTDAIRTTLVTTSRPPDGDILITHSETIKATYSGLTLPIPQGQNLPFDKDSVPAAFLYEFEHSPALDPEKQRAVEFPHEYAQSPDS